MIKFLKKSRTPSFEIAEKIAAEQCRMLYQNLPFNSIFHVTAGFVLCAILWTQGDRENLLWWWLSVAILSVLRVGKYFYYSFKRESHSTSYWNVLFGIGSLLIGLLWGLAGAILSPHGVLSYELFVGFVIAGMVVGAVPVLSSVRGVYLAFAFAAELPYIIHVLGLEGDIYLAVSAIHGLFLLLILLMTTRMNTLIRESLLLRFYNMDLVEKLQGSNELLVNEVESHKQTEIKLRENEQRLIALANATSEGIILHQAEKIIEINQGMSDITGYSVESLLSMDVKELFSEGCRDTVVHYIQSTGTSPIEAELRTSDDAVVPVEIRSGYIPYRGEYVNYIVVRDITHYKELLKAQELGRQKAEEADQSKTEFLAAVSHELRTPLNAVMGFTQLLQDTTLTAEQQEYLSMTYGSAQQLLNLINDLLDLSRIESGHFDLDVIQFNLLDELSDILNLISIKLAESGNMIKVDFSDDLPSEIMADPLRLRQVLLNLLGNAIKFTEKGGIEFTVSIQDGKLCFSVKDSGEGIPEDKQNYIFGKFNQLDSSISRAHGGVGLGLAISKRLVETMGGEISVESKIGEGATFRVILPCIEGKIATSHDGTVEQVKESRAEYPKNKGMEILLVEDDKTNQKIAMAMLEKDGHHVTLAENGQEAIDRCQEDNIFQLILMDIQMPVMDGMTAAHRLREIGITIPIIAITANAMTGDREQYLKEGMTDYISKPIYKESLMQVLSKYKK